MAPAEQPAAPIEFADELNAPGQSAYDIDQAVLEAQRSKKETGVTQYLRGALGALLTPGTIAGWQAETAGALLNTPMRLAGQPDNPTFKALEDFGRSLGKASTGRSAIEALGAAGELVFGEGRPEDVTSAADMARIAVDEQEKAWPLLSAGAQAGGALTVGLASGGGVGGGAKGLAALGLIEGASAGAQAAYDVDAPLTEVWTSAALGGTIGAGLSQVPGAVSAVTRKGRESLAKVFAGEGSTLADFGADRAVKAVGMRGPEIRRVGVERAKQIGKDVLEAHLDDGTPVLPNSPLQAATMDQAELTERLVTSLEQHGQKLGALRQRASAYIDEAAPELRPTPAGIAARVQNEVIAPLERVASPGARAQAAEAMDYIESLAAKRGESMSLEDLFQERLAVDKFDAKFNAKAPEVMNDVRRIMEDEIEQRVAAAAQRSGMSEDYLSLKRMYSSLKEASGASAKASGTDLGNRFFSLSDNIAGAGMLVGDLASGGALSVLKAATVGFGHKILRERGSAIMATLARRFARTPAAVDVAVAGGREAQEAMTEIVRTKNFLRQTADDAGPNPSVRASGENTAEDVAAAELAKRAGPFDPQTWAQAKRAPSPLARLLHRTQILDTVSNDLAPTIERVAATRPGFDFDVPPEKLARLVKDADGPQAIGLVQQRVREVADAAPDSPLLPALEASLQRLDTADVAGAVSEAHNVARLLAANGAETDARSLMLTLGGDEFGQAGKVYRQLTATPSEALQGLANPTKLRETLRTLELRGQLTQQIAEEQRTALAAFEARSRLTGEPVPPEVRQQMRSIEELWSKAEEAVTLDGTRLGRVVDALNNMTESRVASKVPRVPEDQQVAEAIKNALKNIEPSIKPRRGSKGGRTIVQAALRAPSRILTQKERIAEYETRLDLLSQAVVAPNQELQTAALNDAPAPVRAAVAQAQNQKLQTLMRDMPKPKSTIHGPAMNSLSSEEMRRGKAMWEATMQPLSVFEDFRRGDVDYDKVLYAQKQYPKLFELARFGTMDMLQNQLTPDELNALPDSTLTQLDYLLGFKGGLQSTVSVSFSQRIDAVHQQIQQSQGAQPPPPNRGLVLPTSQPTMTQRIAGAQ